MRPPPPLNKWQKYPVTSVTIWLAVGITLYWSANRETSWFLMDAKTWDGQIWRPFTSIFPHVDLVHLIFNLYWLWVFGTLLEETFGRLQFLGILALFAFGSSTAESAFSAPGVGLSGVGYGLFGMILVLSRKDPRFHDAVDGATIAIFVGWFFLCILLTHLEIWPVGNVAHGAGALQGILLGLAVTRTRLCPIYASLSVLFLVGVFVAAAFGQPYCNFSQDARKYYAQTKAFQAYEQQVAGKHERAVALYLEALKVEKNDDRSWYNLGVSYQHLGRMDDAVKAYERAVDINPNEKTYRTALDAIRGKE
jgi:membrane associated rhomboid family serine protease